MAGPPPPLVITGATGFVGRRLIAALREQHTARPTGARDVTLLVRDTAAFAGAGLPTEWRLVACDLANEAPPHGAIAPRSVIVHLAAATGRIAPAVMREVNVEGTRRLVAASVAAGAAHFVFVSSIAASFADRRWYHYAEAKLDAEAIVAASGLASSIVRPAMIFGPGSPVQEGLERLALGGAPIVLGSGAVELQPIHVDDLARFLLALADSPPKETETFEVGGARRLSMRTLIDQVRQVHGLPARRTWSVPLGVPRLLLGFAERFVGTRLPITAGQLASFVNDSSARPNARVESLLEVRHTLGDMLEPAHEMKREAAQDSSPVLHASGADTDERALTAEFATFAAYLGSRDASARVAASYARAHASVGRWDDAFDRWLVVVARASSLTCGLADAYARRARPYGLLRRKLVLALAVLESSPGVHARYDTANPSSALVAWGGIVGAGLVWVARTVLAVILLAPLQLAARLASATGATAARHG